jgi:RNA polymerase sigma factor (sigma-70 family)
MLFAILCLLCALWGFVALTIDTLSRPLALAGGGRRERHGARPWFDLFSLSSKPDDPGDAAPGGGSGSGPPRSPRDIVVAHLKRPKTRETISDGLSRLKVTSHDVDDATQDVLTAAYESANSYRPEVGRVERWVNGIVVKKAADYHDRARRGRQVLASNAGVAVKDPRPSAEDSLGGEQRRLALIAAVLKLPEQEAAVLISHDLNEEGMRFIAARLDTPLSTIYKWRKRGLRALLEALGWLHACPCLSRDPAHPRSAPACSSGRALGSRPAR